MSLRIVPPRSHPTHVSAPYSAPSAPGVPDVLRTNLSLTGPSGTTNTPSSTSARPAPQSTHPLETRLSHWRTTQDALRGETLKRSFGVAAPVARAMEMAVVAAGEWRPAVLGGPVGLHADLLAGRDAELGWEDVFGAGREFRAIADFHTEVEAKLKMNW